MERASKFTVSRDVLATPGRAAQGPLTGGVPEIAVVGYLRCHRDGVIHSANSTLSRWLGYSSTRALEGRPVDSLLGDASRWQAWQSLRESMICRFDLRHRDGRQKPVKAELRPLDPDEGIEFWLSEDAASEMIARVAHLEAALTLTSGTVHDVNNVLTVLTGNLFLLTENLRDREDLYLQARRARNAAERGSTLLRELLTFNRDTDSETKSICPGSHVLALEPLLLRTIRGAGADHELDVTVEPDAGSVVAGPAQFESVLINLVINARDALKSSGRVQVMVGNAEVTTERARNLGIDSGEYVCMKVIDDGVGIPADILPQVAEPLFSTKPRDRGSGLGLAMARSFAESNCGALSIDSVEGHGTQVAVWLPRTTTLAETTANMTLPLSTLPAGEEQLLLLSRDRDVLASLQQILEALGYAVLAAENIEEANRLLTGSPLPAVVICDRSAEAVRMESRWIASLKDANAGLRHVALLQGGADAGSTAPDADGHVFRPVTVLDLARTIRKVLEEV